MGMWEFIKKKNHFQMNNQTRLFVVFRYWNLELGNYID